MKKLQKFAKSAAMLLCAALLLTGLFGALPQAAAAEPAELTTLNMDDLLKAGGWQGIDGDVALNQNEGYLYLGSQCNDAYFNANDYQNFDLTFKLKVDWTNNDQGWGFFLGFRDTNPTVFPWDKNSGYMLQVTQHDVAIIRAAKGLSLVNGTVYSCQPNHQDNTYRLICQDVDNGVRLALHVNGVEVFDVVDTERPLKQAGKFYFASQTGAVGVVRGVQEVQPEPKPEFQALSMNTLLADQQNWDGVRVGATEWGKDNTLLLKPGTVQTVSPKNVNVQDFTLDFAAKVDGGDADWTSIITFRDQMPGVKPWERGKHCYSLQLRKTQVIVRYWENGTVDQLAAYDCNVDGVDHVYRLDCRDQADGVAIKVYVDGKLAIDVVDTKHPLQQAGRISFLNHGNNRGAVRLMGVKDGELPDYNDPQVFTPAITDPKPVKPTMPAETGTATAAEYIKASETSYYLENSKIKVGIDKETGYIRSVSNKESGASYKAEEKGAWPFRILLRDGNVAGITADTPCRVSNAAIAQEDKTSVLTLTYDNLTCDAGMASGVKAVVTFRLNAEDDFFSFDVALDNQSGQDVCRIDLCRGGSIRPAGTNPKMILPMWGDMEYWNDPVQKFANVQVENPAVLSYPARNWNDIEMGFMDLSGSEGGIGLAYINKQMMLMDFRVGSDYDGMSFSPTLLNPEVKRKKLPQYPGEADIYPLHTGDSMHTDTMLVIAHNDDWHRTADIYRKAFQTAFTNADGTPDYLTWETLSPKLKNTDAMLRYHSWKYANIIPDIQMNMESWGETLPGEHMMLWLSGYNENGYGRDVPAMLPVNPNQGTQDEFNAIADYMHDMGGNLWLYEHPFAYDPAGKYYEQVKSADPDHFETGWDGVMHRNLCTNTDVVYNLWKDTIIPNFRNSAIKPDGLQFDQGSQQHAVCTLPGHRHGLDTVSILSSHCKGVDDLAKLVRSNLTETGEAAYIVSEGFCDLTCRHIDMAQTRWDRPMAMICDGEFLLGGNLFVFPERRFHSSAIVGILQDGKTVWVNARQLGALIGGITCLNDGPENTPENCGEYIWLKNEMRRLNAPGYPYNYRDNVGLTTGRTDLVAKVFRDGDRVTITLWNIGQELDHTLTLNPEKLGLTGDVKEFAFQLEPNKVGYIIYNAVTGETENSAFSHKAAPVIEDAGRSLSLDDEIIINNYVTLDHVEGIDLTKDAGMLIWKQPVDEKDAVVGNPDALQQVGLERTEVKGQILYGQRSQGIAAKEYGDTLWLRIYVKNPNGGYEYGRLMPYSVKEYYAKAMEKDNKALQNACRQLLHFGAAAQTLFGYRADNLANAGIAASNSWDAGLLTPVADTPATELTVDAAVKLLGRSLSLDGKILSNFYFKAEGLDVQNAELLVWNNVEGTLTEANKTAAVDMTKTGSDGTFGVQPWGFKANEYETTIFVCAKLTDTQGQAHYSAVVPFSPEGYARLALDKSTNENTKTAMKQLVLYGEAAKLYLQQK